MLQVENNPGDQGLKDTLNELLRDHFFYEEKQFCDSLDLPWDYCKEHKKKHVLFSGKFEENNDIKVWFFLTMFNVILFFSFSGLKTGLFSTSKTQILDTRDI